MIQISTHSKKYTYSIRHLFNDNAIDFKLIRYTCINFDFFLFTPIL